MAKRHVVDYFNKVAEQYSEMLATVRELEDECNNSIVEPERLENAEKMLEPIKNNYMTWSYMMYLLNLPNRESKVKSTIKRGKPVDDVGGFDLNKENLIKLKNGCL